MDIEKLKERADLALQETKLILERLNGSADTFEKSCHDNLIKIMREETVKEIVANEKQIMEEVEKKKQSITSIFPFTEEKMVWVYGFSFETGDGTDHGFGVTEIEKGDEGIIKGMERKKDYRYLPSNEFRKKIEKLKAQTLAGRLDRFLRISSREIIYKLLGFKSELWDELIKFEEVNSDQSVK